MAVDDSVIRVYDRDGADVNVIIKRRGRDHFPTRRCRPRPGCRLKRQILNRFKMNSGGGGGAAMCVCRASTYVRETEC